MQLAVEGLQVPDVRDAEEEDVAAFNNFLDKASTPQTVAGQATSRTPVTQTL